MSETITTPVGRLVEGSLYKGNEFNAENQPLVFKTGKNAGQPRVDYYFALAIPKGNETHWNQTEWGKVIYNVGKVAFPKGQWERPDFSWKITDGDSTVLNKANRRPCDKEGFPGNWVLKFSRSFAPKIYNADGSQLITEENYVNLGDFMQVHALIAGNDSDKQPGVYLNHMMVAFSAYGERIVLGPDPKSVGFGNAPLPPGASATPPASFVPPVQPVSYVACDDQGKVTSGVMPPPYPQILNVPPAPTRVMTPKANGITYEQYKQAGWTDEQMIAEGVLSI
jgi:hypothetical protein